MPPLVVLLTLTHPYNAVRGHRTGFEMWQTRNETKQYEVQQNKTKSERKRQENRSTSLKSTFPLRQPQQKFVCGMSSIDR